MLKPKPASALLALAASLSAPVQTEAVDPDRLLLYSYKRLSVRPQLVVAEAFSDNVYFRETGVESDFITLISPGVKFQIGRKDEEYVALDYNFDNYFYASEDSLNAQQHRLALAGRLEAKRIKLEGKDTVEFLSGVLSGSLAATGRKVDRFVNDHTYMVTYDFSDKTSLYGRGTYQEVDYENSVPLYDLNTLVGTLGAGYKPFTKTRFFGEVYYGQTAVNPNAVLVKPPHSEFIGGFLGVTGDFTEKLQGTVKAGYEYRVFSDNTPTPSAPVVELGLTYKLSEKTQLGLAYNKRTAVSVESARQSYSIDQIILTASQWIGTGERFRASARVAYEHYAYETTGTLLNRTDQYLRATAELTYFFKIWLRGNLGYSFEKFDTDFTGAFDYDVNQVILSVSIGY